MRKTELADHLAEVQGPSIEVDYDYFWSIPPEKMYDVLHDPKPENLSIGQVYDSWRFLEKLLTTDREPIGYDLVWLADVLRAIGHQTAGDRTPPADRHPTAETEPC